MKMLGLLPPAAAGLALAGAYGAYRYVFYSPVGSQNDDYVIPAPARIPAYRGKSMALIRALNEKPFERVFIRSFDGLKLTGRYYPARDGAPLAILFHGYRGTPSRDFSGGASLFMELGYRVLNVEQRGQCGSEGHTISFGVNERRDCLSWASYAAERFGPETPIVLAGISMGASTVLMASELTLPVSVRGIIADCPFTSPAAIIKSVARQMHVPPAVYPLAQLGARVFGGFSLDGADAVSAVRRARVPILLIHGEADSFVPCSMTRKNYAACRAPKKLLLVPGAIHGLSYVVMQEEYEAIEKQFWAENDGKPAAK